MEGEDHGTCEELGNAARKNSPVYGDRYVGTVMPGTRETLPRTGTSVKGNPISPKGEMVRYGKGVGEGCNTYETRTT